MIRLGLRARLFATVMLAVTAALVVGVLGFNLLLGRELARSADGVARARATAELGVLRPAGAGLEVGEAPDDATPDAAVWVFSGGRALEAPRTSGAVDAAARALAARAPALARYGGLRLYATPAVFGGRRYGSVVSAVSLAPYDKTRKAALLASLAFAVVLLAVVAVAARWLLNASLRPVRALTRQASAWSEHDLDRRFAMGEPYDELTELAATLDGLLDRLAASLRREQRFSAEVAHELRTPLARIGAEVELALRRERVTTEYRTALELVQRNAEQLSRTVDALVAAARAEAGGSHGTANAYAVAGEVVQACATLAAALDVTIDVRPPSRPLRIGVDPELGERILQPLVENACRYGRSRVEVSFAREPAGVIVEIADDGPGVAAGEAERIFDPGARGGAGLAADGAGGAGLGLALARRLARGADGDVEAAAGPGGRFLVRLPPA